MANKETHGIPVPALLGDRFLLLGALITPRALALAQNRLVNHKQRIDKEADDLGTKRIALILVREMNPVIHLINEEEAILRGLDADTVGKMKTQGTL